MKATPQSQNQKAEILQRYEKGEITLQDLKADQLGIGTGGVHFAIRGLEEKGCLDPVQIDQIDIPDEEPILLPCENAYFFNPPEGAVVILLGQKEPDPDQIKNAPRRPSDYACIAVMDEFGTRSPRGSTPEEEAARSKKLDEAVYNERKSLRTLLK